MTSNIKLHCCVILFKDFWVGKKAISVQVWNLWLFQLHTSLDFFFSCFVFFGLQFKDMHSRCNKGNVWERSWSSQYMRIIIVYSMLAVSTEMQWVVWCNIKMWFIFTVNTKSFKFATECFHFILGLQTSKLWMVQTVHNNKSVISYTFLAQSCFCVPSV